MKFMPNNENSISTKEEGLLQARQFLRKQQEKAATGVQGFPYARFDNITEQALKSLKDQREVIPTDDPHIVRRGAFRFNREMEEERIRLSEDLVRRVQPGPFEDPNYFALLTYQAASIEMAMRALLKKDNDRFSLFLLGTIHKPDVNAFAEIFPCSGYTVVVLHSAIIDFVYQAAKAVVETLNPIRTINGTSAVHADTRLEKIRAELGRNPAPADRIYRTLESYFFYGYPRAFANEPIKEEHVPVLSILISMAERWIIAHEYGHGLAIGRNFHSAPSNESWAKEFFADTQAAILSVYSADLLDSLPPEFALSGGNFTLACLDVLRRAQSILQKKGHESPDRGSDTHPPYEVRAEQNLAAFRQFFDVEYKNRGLFDLKFVIRKEPPKDHTFGSEEHIRRVYEFSTVLFEIWPYVKAKLIQQVILKRPLHTMWQ
jgi:hypothetical protein